jgi:hypothetical protein
MAGYQPLYIKGNETGLVQNRQEFILPNDAYPILENAYIFREQLKRKQGCQLLGRLRRDLINYPTTGSPLLGVTDGSGNFSGNLFTILVSLGYINASENSGIVLGMVNIHVNAFGTFIENSPPNGTLSAPFSGTGIINYATGAFSVSTAGAAPGQNVHLYLFSYYPGLPVMGLRSRQLNTINNEMTIAFDTIYAYRFVGTSWQEFIPGTVWTGDDSDLFWTTNYWVSAANAKLFWVTNFSGITGDPIRYTDGITWTTFAPVIDAAGNLLTQCLCIIPFRGRLVVFNTLEGANLATSVSYPNRIRWAAIGSPFTTNAWRDDIRGQGGFLDIPTSENIISVGFVRDNLVVYCESSTWQLRYTGRSIAPFQIEKVNSELGAESTFSAIQFDTSLVGIGDKGIVECDSYKSERIDIKIPDLVYLFQNQLSGPKRVYGIRNFQKRLAFWTYPYQPTGAKFPNRRFVYNYEKDTLGIYIDSFTALGTFQPQTSRTWAGTVSPWRSQNYAWFDTPALFPDIVGGNQEGYVVYLDKKVTNDVTLAISNIVGNSPLPTVLTVIDHNFQIGQEGQIIQISGIPIGTPFANLNGGIFEVDVINSNSFRLFLYDPTTQEFSTPQTDTPGTYIGGGQISVKDNFRIVSKKFNFLDEGQNIQLGFIDILMDDTSTANGSEDGEISLKVYVDYNNSSPVNILPQNSQSDTFFNASVPTYRISGEEASKNFQRVFCPVRGAFITIEWTLSNLQMTTGAQESDVQIDLQILWIRKAGKLLPRGV